MQLQHLAFSRLGWDALQDIAITIAFIFAAAVSRAIAIASTVQFRLPLPLPCFVVFCCHVNLRLASIV